MCRAIEPARRHRQVRLPDDGCLCRCHPARAACGQCRGVGSPFDAAYRHDGRPLPPRPCRAARMVELLREGIGRGCDRTVVRRLLRDRAAADVDELALLAGIAGDASGIYTHIRNEMNRSRRARRGIFGRAARQRAMVISHRRCTGPQNSGRTARRWPTSTRRDRREPIGLDACPYVTGSTVLRADLIDGIIDVVVTSSEPHPEIAARTWPTSRPSGLHATEACERLQPGRRLLSRCARTMCSACCATQPR